MKKKLLSLILGAVMVLSLAGCGSGSKAGFTDDDLVFKGSEDLKVALDHFLFIADDYADYENMYVDDWTEYEEAFTTSRGLEIGMTLEDYQKLYNIKYGSAVWELLTYDNYTYLDYYTNQSPADMYNDDDIDVNTLWLDLGWYKDGSSWKSMTDEELMDVWFCEADLSDFGEVVILSVHVDEGGEIGAMYMYHFTYDDDWVEWQSWG